MTNRRQFLASLALASGSTPLLRPRRSTPRVETTATIFYAHPAGETTLVRFVVRDTDAPAGRLRVFDQGGRRLLGTAGVLGAGGSLFGELWLPLQNTSRIISQLEMPGLSRPIRTAHSLTPRPQWTLHWVTIIDPRRLIDSLEQLPLWRRYAALATLQQLKVYGNPFPTPDQSLQTLDHVAFLRAAHPAHRLQRDFGIPMGSVALGSAQNLEMRASALALQNVSIPYAVSLNQGTGSVFHTLDGRDGSIVTAASLPPRSTVRDLLFTEGGDQMAREIERWLTETPAFIAPSYGTTVALILQTNLDDQLAQIAQAVADWNSRYAFPHITVGTPDDFFREAGRIIGSGIAQPPAPSSARSRPMPSADELEQTRDNRNAQRISSVEQLLAPLNALLRSRAPGIRGIAEHLDIPLDGTLVLNPSPIPRTDIITMPSGSEQLATDIPGMGYAYLLGRSSSAPQPFVQLGTHSVFGQFLTVRLDPQTGAISSLYHRSDGREWVRPGSPGLNAVPGAVLEHVTRLRLPEIGMRLIAERRTDRGRLTTTVTGYESLPWIDITNEFHAERGNTAQYDYHFNVDRPHVSWETPVGFEEAVPPVGPVAHFHWLRLRSGDDWQVLFRGLDAPYAACDASGRIVSLAPTGRSRYRLQLASPYARPDEPWHFGWSTEPFVVVPVAASSTRRGTLPRFGHLLAFDEPGVAVLGIKQADNGDGAIVYLQELLGATRQAKLAAGILGFRQARHVAALERHLGELPVSPEPAVTVSLPAHGVVVVRLLDLFIRGA